MTRIKLLISCTNPPLSLHLNNSLKVIPLNIHRIISVRRCAWLDGRRRLLLLLLLLIVIIHGLFVLVAGEDHRDQW